MRSCSQRRLQALRPDRPAVPARLHRQVLGARASAGSPPRSTARSSTTSATSWPARPRPFVKRIETRDVRRLRRARTTSGPPGCATTSAPCKRAMEKQAVVLGDGTDADVIALAEDPLEVAVQIFYVRGGRIRGQRGWVADRVDDGDTGELVERLPAPALRRRVPTTTRSRARSWCRRCRPTPRRFEELLAELRGSRVVDPGAAARRQEGAAGDRRPQRRAVADAAQDQAGQRPDHPQPGAGGDPGGARADDGAAAHRVLRHLQPAGHRGGRLDGGLRGRPGPQERVPPVRDHGRRRPERRRVDARGDHPAVPAAARRASETRARAEQVDGPTTGAARC